MGGASASLLHPMDKDSAIPRNRDFGRSQFGCEHYKRRCKIRAPCCNLIFPCRHCHNDAANALPDPKERHDLVRQNVTQVICSVCEAEQEVAQVCSNCGVCMGEYFCNICNFFDDEVFFCILLLYIVSFSITLLLLGRPQNNNFIVTTVGFVELVGVTISFIAKAVELVIQWACAIITHALRTPLRTLVLSVTRFVHPNWN
ncbi:hypothetical protein DY000_02056933 [Brassica cretica]|uniref:CHY-type domain-containing protein n=1 Tax=Brassica cretica TaxID=69181 RepID=A0ABQ7AHD4_BRACR|nr:hypothetical protein DY000_02056933 [Brassica cretica]